MKQVKTTRNIFDAILLDLLSSGLGAVIILMLIFSLNLSGVFSSVKSNSFEPPLPNIGDASLVDKDHQKEKSMSSMRFVTIKDLSKSSIEQLRIMATTNELWVRKGEKWKDAQFKKLLDKLNVKYQLEIKGGSVTFYYFIDHVLDRIELQIPESVKLGGGRVKAGIIEGASTVPAESLPEGIYGTKEKMLDGGTMGLLVVFNTDNLRSSNLINIK